MTLALDYRSAGVDIAAGDSLVDSYKEAARRSHRREVLSELGGFGAMCEIPAGYRQPVLVSSTDGVGTKLKLATALGIHDTVGIDLVAMCVNDLIVCGAEPLSFLDYYATGRLDTAVARVVVDGIGRGCELAGCALIGGETAEMPDMYAPGDYDLAGFAQGVVEKERIIAPRRARPGDRLIGLPSSGPHANGYSLIRKILELSGTSLDEPFGDSTLGATLLRPTEIYAAPVRALIDTVDIHAIAHITGGGIVGNLPRSLPENLQAVIDLSAWRRPAIFQWLQTAGGVAEEEMLRTFNCGLGMIVAVAAADVTAAVATLQAAGIPEPLEIGELAARAPAADRLRLLPDPRPPRPPTEVVR